MSVSFHGPAGCRQIMEEIPAALRAMVLGDIGASANLPLLQACRRRETQGARLRRERRARLAQKGTDRQPDQQGHASDRSPMLCFIHARHICCMEYRVYVSVRRACLPYSVARGCNPPRRTVRWWAACREDKSRCRPGLVPWRLYLCAAKVETAKVSTCACLVSRVQSKASSALATTARTPDPSADA